MRARVEQVVVDRADPRSLVRFWAALLGEEPVDRDRGWSHVEAPGPLRISFQPVPEAEAAKNRLRLDVVVDDVAAATAEAERLGARRVGAVHTDEQGSFQVVLDPEGNEFRLVSD